MKLSIAVAAASLAMLGSVAQAQSLLYRPPNSSESNPEIRQSPNCNTAIPFSQIVGRKVVFLAKTKQFQRFGFQTWHYENGHASPTYQDVAGKVGTVTYVDPSKGDNAGFRGLAVKLDDSGETLTAEALDDSVNEIVFLDDLDFAKSRYVGKTLWIKNGEARTSQDVETYDGIKLRKFSPVKVIDAVPGTSKYDPVDLVIEAEDHPRVLVSLHLSLSNMSVDMISRYQKDGRLCGFDNAFLLEDPHLTHHWSAAVWKNIEMGRVVVGMTLEQAIMAKGDPMIVNKATPTSAVSSAMFDDKVMVFLNRNGVVTSIVD